MSKETGCSRVRHVIPTTVLIEADEVSVRSGLFLYFIYISYVNSSFAGTEHWPTPTPTPTMRAPTPLGLGKGTGDRTTTRHTHLSLADEEALEGRKESTGRGTTRKLKRQAGRCSRNGGLLAQMRSRSSLEGSSTPSLMRLRKPTAPLPSMSRWS